jgi:hypothetical protein
VLATLGKRDREAGDPRLTEHEKRLARRQAVGIVLKSMVVAVVITAAIYFLPWTVG